MAVFEDSKLIPNHEIVDCETFYPSSAAGPLFMGKLHDELGEKNADNKLWY